MMETPQPKRSKRKRRTADDFVAEKTREARQVTLYKVSNFRHRQITVDSERGVTRSLFF